MPTPAPDDASTYLLPQSLLPRALAYVIDAGVVAVTTAVLIAAGVLRGSGFQTLDPSSLRETLESSAGLAVYAILFGYFVICEGVWGRTIGKRVLGMSVVKARDGSPCGWPGSIVRNLLRPIDLFFAGLPGAVIVIFSPARQRLGDMLAATLVVREVKAPAAVVGLVPGLLRRCGQCGRLAPAAGPCPGCSSPAPAPTRAAAMTEVLQPLAGMMAVGEAVAALRAAAHATLAAEDAFATASAAESARLARVEGAGTPAEAGAAAAGAGEGESEAFVHTADAPELSDDYVAAWRGLMTAVETLRERRADLEATLARARVSMEQVAATDPLLRELLHDVEPYLGAEDDEGVLAAFMGRQSGPEGGAASPAT